MHKHAHAHSQTHTNTHTLSLTQTHTHTSTQVLDFVPSDLARTLGALAELEHRNPIFLEAAATRLRVTLIPTAQLQPEEIAKVGNVQLRVHVCRCACLCC